MTGDQLNEFTKYVQKVREERGYPPLEVDTIHILAIQLEAFQKQWDEPPKGETK